MKSTGACEGAEAIRDKHVDLNFENVKVDLEQGTFDVQSSLDGGFIILVTGSFVFKGNSKPQKFVQTFFLHKAEERFYVLNNLLRVLPAGASSSKKNGDAKVTPSKVVTAAAANNDANGDAKKNATPKTKKEKEKVETKRAAEDDSAEPATEKVEPKVKGAQGQSGESGEKEATTAKKHEAATESEKEGGSKKLKSRSKKAPKKSSGEKKSGAEKRAKENGAEAQTKPKGPMSWASVAATAPVLSANTSAANAKGKSVKSAQSKQKAMPQESDKGAHGNSGAVSTAASTTSKKKRGKKEKVQPTDEVLSRSIFVKEVTGEVSKDEIKSMFASFGSVHDVEFYRKKSTRL